MVDLGGGAPAKALAGSGIEGGDDGVEFLVGPARDLSCTGLVGHSIEEILDLCGDLGLGGDRLAGHGDGDLA